MTTRIRDLPLIGVDLDLTTVEDWLDAWAYVDAAGNPIPLTGLSLTGIFRPGVESEQVSLFLCTADLTPPAGLRTGGLVVGGADLNVLAMAVVKDTIRDFSAGTYGFDVVARADGTTRRIAVGLSTVSRGYSR